jgi:hypothetical protein
MGGLDKVTELWLGGTEKLRVRHIWRYKIVIIYAGVPILHS